MKRSCSKNTVFRVPKVELFRPEKPKDFVKQFDRSSISIGKHSSNSKRS